MAKTTNEPTTEKSLRDSLDNMHALANGALSRIHGMARCALRALETEAGVRDLECIAEVLNAIAIDADMAYNYVAVEAENHGIQTTDAAWERRLKATHNPRPNHAAMGSA